VYEVRECLYLVSDPCKIEKEMKIDLDISYNKVICRMPMVVIGVSYRVG